MVSIAQVVFFIGVGIFGLSIVMRHGGLFGIAIILGIVACLIPIARFIFRR